MRFLPLLLVPLVATAHDSASRSTRIVRDRHLVCTTAKDAARVDCVGPIEARSTLLAELDGTDVDRARDAAIDAAYFDVREAIPKLRPWLALPSDSFPHRELRGEAAYVLAQLGDAPSASAIEATVRDFETTGHGFLWADTLAALARLDPARASRYAIDFARRTTDWRISMPGGSGKLPALDYITIADAAKALPVLERQAKGEETGYAHAHCELMAARVRLDEQLRVEVREKLLGHYGGSWLAGCAESVLSRLGATPADAAVLVRHLGRDDRGMDFGVANIAYARILELLTRLPEDDPARATLRRGLEERNRWPHVADPKSASYSLHYVAYHQAGLAGLGDAKARQALFAVIDGTDVDTAWLAAYWALRLALPGGIDRAMALAVRSVTSPPASRSGIYAQLRGRVLDTLADVAKDDGRWAVMLLDPDEHAFERALYRLARQKPRGACEVVTAAAKAVPASSVMTQTDRAFWALTALGPACIPALERLFVDDKVTGEVRGSALEVLAALEAPKTCSHVTRARQDKIWRPAIERAVAISRPRCP